MIRRLLLLWRKPRTVAVTIRYRHDEPFVVEMMAVPHVRDMISLMRDGKKVTGTVRDVTWTLDRRTDAKLADAVIVDVE